MHTLGNLPGLSTDTGEQVTGAPTHDAPEASDEGPQAESMGPGRKEVRTMANPPVCRTCGSILMGYGWSKELNFPVHYCTDCVAKQEASQKAKEAA